jgi:AcrR family transcriptional regulator
MNQATRDRIIHQAIKCLAQNSNAGLDEIAKRAEVGRATLYRYFKSRAELITAIQLSAGEQLHAVVDPILEKNHPAREKLLKIVTRLVPLGSSLNVSAYFNHPVKDEDPRVMESYEKHVRQSRQLCMDLKEEKAVRTDLPLVWLMSTLDALIFEAWVNVEKGEIPAKQAPWLVLNTFLGGHGTPDTLNWLNEHIQAY